MCLQVLSHTNIHVFPSMHTGIEEKSDFSRDLFMNIYVRYLSI